MSTAARKARKRAGEKLVKEPKVGTPFLQRSWFTNPVPAFHGSAAHGMLVPRSKAQVERALKARGITKAED